MAKVKLRVCKELARAEVVDGVLTAEENGVAVEIELIGEIWDGLSTTLVCRGGGQERKMLIQDGKSIVPWECLIGGEMLYMGVDGWNEDGIHIPSSFAEVQIVLGSVAETDAIPGNPPSPDIAAQIIIVMEGLDERIKALEQGGGSGAVTSVNGKTGEVELTAEDVGALSTDDAEILAEKVDRKMVKHILDYDGTHIKEDGENLTFAVLYEMLMEKPDFCVLVYNNYAYHPNGVSTSQIVFSSEYPVNGYDRAHRITMLANGTVTATETESEHTSSRVNAITEANEGSTVQYPSVKATADYVKPIKQGLTQCLKTPAEANVGQMFVVKSKNADGSVVLEAVDTPSGGVTDVQVAGTSVVQDGVANVPGAANGNRGVVSVNVYGLYGLRAGSYGGIGGLSIQNASEAHIDQRSSAFHPVTPNVLDYAVKAAMTDGKGAAWTAEEQLAGRQRLGLPGKWEMIEEFTIETDTNTFSRTAEPNGVPYSFDSILINFSFIGSYVNNQYVQLIAEFDNKPLYANGIRANNVNFFRNINYSGDAFIILQNVGGLISGKITDGNTNRGYITASSCTLEAIEHWISDNSKINKITVNQQTAFKAGTVVRICGVRA